MTLDRGALAMLDPVQQNVIVIIQAMLDHQTPAGEGQQILDPNLSVEACIVAAAALLETEYDETLEARAKKIAEKMVGYTKVFRDEHRQSGETALEQIGAIGVSQIRIQ